MTAFEASHPTRRLLLAGLAITPLIGRAQDRSPIRICQSTALSGPLSDLGQAMHQGARACFAAINGMGGIGGRPIELVTLDDGYEVQRAVANVNGFIADKRTFALFNCMGTAMIQAMLPKVIESGIPFFAPFTGALLARPAGVRSIFMIRPSYFEEAEQLVQHLATIGIRRIGIAYQNNLFGKEIYDGARAALDRHKLADAVAVTVETDASDAADAAGRLAAANPQAVLLGMAGKPTLNFVKGVRAQRKGLPLYALSIMGAADTLKLLGEDAIGMTVSQVMPSPRKVSMQIVRDFQRDWKAASNGAEASYVALEGYINARVFAEALNRAGRNLTRAAFIESTWGLRSLDVGGFEVNFTEPGKSASRFVDLTMVGRDGRFIR
ncbi:MAG: ABC transporter substrate-binding protein [Variovorax sp.]